MHVCPRCGEENPEHARFCLRCGEPLGAPPNRGRQERKFATALFADLVGSTALPSTKTPRSCRRSWAGVRSPGRGDHPARGPAREVHGRRGPGRVRRPTRARGRRRTRRATPAIEMQAVLSELNREFAAEGKPQLAMRIGVEAGEVLVDVERASGPATACSPATRSTSPPGCSPPPTRAASSSGPTVVRGHEGRDRVPRARPAHLEGQGRARAGMGRPPRPRPPARRAARARAWRRSSSVATRSSPSWSRPFQRVQAEAPPGARHDRRARRRREEPPGREFDGYVEGLPKFVYWRAVGAWPTATPRTRRSPTRSRRSARSSTTTPTEVALEEGQRCRRIAVRRQGTRPADRRARGRGRARRVQPRGPVRCVAALPRADGRALPVVLVLEDIHWADDALLDFIEHLADWAQGPIMVLTLARPELFENRPTWGGGKRNAISIYLDPLSADESAAMLVGSARRRHDRRAASARSWNAARATRSTSRRSSAS